MRKLILFLLLLASPAWAGGVISGAVLSGCSTGGGAGGCNPASNEVGDRQDITGDATLAADNMACILYEADCSGTLGVAYARHSGTQEDNVKICVYNSVFQTDITSSHKPDNSDTMVSGSSCVTISSSASEWANSGASKVGGSVTSGVKYLVCMVADTTQWKYYIDTTAGNYAYQNTSSSYTSPPATLTGAWGAYAPRSISFYVTIE